MSSTSLEHAEAEVGLGDRGGARDRQMTVAQALVSFLLAQYSSRDGEEQRLIPAMFGIFGHGNVAGMSQALAEYGSGLPYYQPFNEQSMVHTAVGYAKACNRRATLACSASIGPGSTNMVTGAALATINRLPVLLLPSDYYATRRQGPVLQQLEHPVSFDESVNDAFRPVSRFFDRVSRPEQLIESLYEAMRVLTDPAETGAVTIALPQDVQSEAARWPSSLFKRRVWDIERRPPSTSRVREALAMLSAASRPVIIAGGGVHYSEAWAELAEFAEAFSIPVAETSAGKGAFRGRPDLQLDGIGVTGSPAAGAVARDADLVICIGTRLTDFPTGSRSLFQHPDVRFLAVNVSGHDASKMGALALLADAREGLGALLTAGREAGVGSDLDYAAEVRAIRDRWRERLERDVLATTGDEPLTQPQMLGILNRQAVDGDTVVAAAGSPPGDLLQMWDCAGGRHAHLEFGYSCMGYEIPASLGVRLAQPEGEVYTFIGDGTFLMNPSELATAAQEGLKITVMLSRNHGFQCIRDLQLRSSGVDFGNEFRARDAASNRLEGSFVEIDYVQIAEGLGARAWHVHTGNEFETALAEARAESRPCLIVVDTDPYLRGLPSEVWWDVAPAEVSGDERTQQARAEYERGRAQQRAYR
ncbi:MAG: 3D-(3,5/4)-trihydroxycyclohexane-1,2-dione acylhydrolase (decyclizing) [Solirubrobacteraceae bacterium]